MMTMTTTVHCGDAHGRMPEGAHKDEGRWVEEVLYWLYRKIMNILNPVNNGECHDVFGLPVYVY